MSPNGPADGIHPSAPARPQEPIQAPPAPKDPPAGPTREGSPTPIPVPIPKISPSASVNGAVPGASPAATPPVDPSIPLERQLNLNHVGFRKADPKRELYNGWKPVAELPKSLR